MSKKYFKKCDLIIYSIILFVWIALLSNILKTSNEVGSKVEIYVSGELKHLYKLQVEKKIIMIDTILGGVKLEFENNKVRAISSNSPLKLIVKQGWIDKPGDALIGIPDKMVVKIIGKKNDEEELDFVLR